jgi:hypothetical protein
MKRPVAVALAALTLSLAAGCAAGPGRNAPPDLPPDLQADYQVFAVRCSKCHPLARPLQAGITDDRHWATYVARMRLQPGSGISAQDAPRILRFLSYYSHRQQQQDAR